jgi:formiminotetrahydrofolate cyclodeaminase
MADSKALLSMSVEEFIAAVSARKPVPGGVTVAGVIGALAVAMGELTLNYSKGKKSLCDHAATHEQLGQQLHELRQLCQYLTIADAEAYGQYAAVQKMDDGPEKEHASVESLNASIDIPRRLASAAIETLQSLKELVGVHNTMLSSDLVAAAELARATTVLCDMNVRINTPHLADEAAAEQYRAESLADRETAERLAKSIEQETMSN